jgi:hypothetical protein
MSSSYSPDLRIELIGTGDQAGVWGNTTNTNLGTLMENAVAGYTSVSIIASPQALTANDGALDEARFAALALTTTTGANFTVCIPPNSKLYTFYNASPYTATISNSTVKNGIVLSGGTTVAIPTMKTVSVWSDGADVAQQTNHLISPSLVTPTITGVSVAPTAAFGTNTTQLATAAFVQAALQALYPVGCVYTSTSATNPGTTFGFGTWVAFAAGRVMVGVGGAFTAGATGGSADDIVVSHTHTYSSTTGGQSASHTHSGVTDGNGGHYHGTGQYNDNNGVWFYGSYNQSGPTGSGTFWNGSGGGGAGGQSAPTAGNTVTSYPINDNTAGTHTHGFSTGGVSADHNHSVSGTTASTGASGTNANLQPYIVVYVWNRTV